MQIGQILQVIPILKKIAKVLTTDYCGRPNFSLWTWPKQVDFSFECQM